MGAQDATLCRGRGPVRRGPSRHRGHPAFQHGRNQRNLDGHCQEQARPSGAHASTDGKGQQRRRGSAVCESRPLRAGRHGAHRVLRGRRITGGARRRGDRAAPAADRRYGATDHGYVPAVHLDGKGVRQRLPARVGRTRGGDERLAPQGLRKRRARAHHGLTPTPRHTKRRCRPHRLDRGGLRARACPAFPKPRARDRGAAAGNHPGLGRGREDDARGLHSGGRRAPQLRPVAGAHRRGVSITRNETRRRCRAREGGEQDEGRGWS